MLEDAIRLDEETHTYYYNDREVPGVTSILSAVGISNDYFYDSLGSIRGKFLHRAVQLYHSDTGVGKLDPRLVPYFDGYLRFVDDTGFVPVDSEKLVFNKAYMYAGTLDLRGPLFDFDSVIDIKTGLSLPKEVGIQLSGYALACEVKPKRKYSLHLPGNGMYGLNRHKYPRDEKVFLSAVTVVNYTRGLL